ncbi:DUF1801 domain-containing protein [Phaeovulum sp.]|uniref:DUF1801 domain-containing protein n=1 Tax=Phaeovulum sp. TaxID=2934796 RepID=UPI002731E082|nr:DUF1801 domain-containing protein [Phaeovulum sp.]MDP1670383.1 DUF1801 domain-containing protein [Phaeovulum sp.]MDZ4120712.1 DUF1801 domain-containing protein [Phaeovulum sp.]
MTETPPARPARKAWKPKVPLPPLAPGEVRLLTGGNPQIAKADGDAPVQAYIAAMPGWKRAVGARIDALIAEEVPQAARAVRWNAPFWGLEGQGWMLSLACVARYVKVSFLKGTALAPLPPEPSKVPNLRYLHIFEDGFDEAQFRDWLRQAFAMPGARMF